MQQQQQQQQPRPNPARLTQPTAPAHSGRASPLLPAKTPSRWATLSAHAPHLILSLSSACLFPPFLYLRHSPTFFNVFILPTILNQRHIALHTTPQHPQLNFAGPLLVRLLSNRSSVRLYLTRRHSWPSSHRIVTLRQSLLLPFHRPFLALVAVLFVRVLASIAQRSLPFRHFFFGNLYCNVPLHLHSCHLHPPSSHWNTRLLPSLIITALA